LKELFYNYRIPLNRDNSKNRSPVGFNSNIQLTGLDNFIKNLEKHFFSRATVRCISSDPCEINLVIEIDCNFELHEALDHLGKGTWGNFKNKKDSFAGSLQLLQECNDITIKVEEFSLFLNDTAVIVNRIYDQSISQQLENILSTLDEHYFHFIKDYAEVPYEIYIPVFEDNPMESEPYTLLQNIDSGNNSFHDYFSFWGLYYYSEEDALIYDLKNETIIDGKLQMLNR